MSRRNPSRTARPKAKPPSDDSGDVESDGHEASFASSKPKRQSTQKTNRTTNGKEQSSSGKPTATHSTNGQSSSTSSKPKAVTRHHSRSSRSRSRSPSSMRDSEKPSTSSSATMKKKKKNQPPEEVTIPYDGIFTGFDDEGFRLFELQKQAVLEERQLFPLGAPQGASTPRNTSPAPKHSSPQSDPPMPPSPVLGHRRHFVDDDEDASEIDGANEGQRKAPGSAKSPTTSQTSVKKTVFDFKQLFDSDDEEEEDLATISRRTENKRKATSKGPASKKSRPLTTSFSLLAGNALLDSVFESPTTNGPSTSGPQPSRTSNTPFVGVSTHRQAQLRNSRATSGKTTSSKPRKSRSITSKPRCSRQRLRSVTPDPDMWVDSDRTPSPEFTWDQPRNRPPHGMKADGTPLRMADFNFDDDNQPSTSGPQPPRPGRFPHVGRTSTSSRVAAKKIKKPIRSPIFERCSSLEALSDVEIQETDDRRDQDLLSKGSKGKASKAKASKAKDSQGKVSEAKVSEAKVSEAKVSNTKVSKAKVSKAKVSKAKVSKAKVSKTEDSGTTDSEAEATDSKAKDSKPRRIRTKAKTKNTKTAKNSNSKSSDEEPSPIDNHPIKTPRRSCQPQNFSQFFERDSQDGSAEESDENMSEAEIEEPRSSKRQDPKPQDPNKADDKTMKELNKLRQQAINHSLKVFREAELDCVRENRKREQEDKKKKKLAAKKEREAERAARLEEIGREKDKKWEIQKQKRREKLQKEFNKRRHSESAARIRHLKAIGKEQPNAPKPTWSTRVTRQHTARLRERADAHHASQFGWRSNSEPREIGRQVVLEPTDAINRKASKSRYLKNLDAALTKMKRELSKVAEFETQAVKRMPSNASRNWAMFLDPYAVIRQERLAYLKHSLIGGARDPDQSLEISDSDHLEIVNDRWNSPNPLKRWSDSSAKQVEPFDEVAALAEQFKFVSLRDLNIPSCGNALQVPAAVRDNALFEIIRKFQIIIEIYLVKSGRNAPRMAQYFHFLLFRLNMLKGVATGDDDQGKQRYTIMRDAIFWLPLHIGDVIDCNHVPRQHTVALARQLIRTVLNDWPLLVRPCPISELHALYRLELAALRLEVRLGPMDMWLSWWKPLEVEEFWALIDDDERDKKGLPVVVNIPTRERRTRRHSI